MWLLKAKNVLIIIIIFFKVNHESKTEECKLFPPKLLNFNTSMNTLFYLQSMYVL